MGMCGARACAGAFVIFLQLLYACIMQKPLDSKTSLPDATVVYLSKDPIQNLQVKVSIRRVVLAELAETGSLNTNTTPEASAQPDTAQADRAVAFTEVFRWQQKKEDNPQSPNEVYLFTRIDGETENVSASQSTGEPNAANSSGCFGGSTKPAQEGKRIFTFSLIHMLQNSQTHATAQH